jgi:hypothetical protein
MYKLSQTAPSPSSSGEEQQKKKKNSVVAMGGAGRNNDTEAADDTSHKNPYGLSARPQVETSFLTQSPSSGNSGSIGSNMMMMKKNGLYRSLPPLFLYMESGDLRRAAERAKNHPREVKTWASIKIKSSSGGHQAAKRLALHQACFKVRRFIFACLLL